MWCAGVGQVNQAHPCHVAGSAVCKEAVFAGQVLVRHDDRTRLRCIHVQGRQEVKGSWRWPHNRLRRVAAGEWMGRGYWLIDRSSMDIDLWVTSIKKARRNKRKDSFQIIVDGVATTRRRYRQRTRQDTCWPRHIHTPHDAAHESVGGGILIIR